MLHLEIQSRVTFGDTITCYIWRYYVRVSFLETSVRVSKFYVSFDRLYLIMHVRVSTFYQTCVFQHFVKHMCVFQHFVKRACFNIL